MFCGGDPMQPGFVMLLHPLWGKQSCRKGGRAAPGGRAASEGFSGQSKWAQEAYLEITYLEFIVPLEQISLLR